MAEDHQIQREELTRVLSSIADYVIKFASERTGEVFTASDLCEYVWKFDRCIAPASPDRILRALKRAGAVCYDVVDRSKSSYRITAVEQ